MPNIDSETDLTNISENFLVPNDQDIIQNALLRGIINQHHLSFRTSVSEDRHFRTASQQKPSLACFYSRMTRAIQIMTSVCVAGCVHTFYVWRNSLMEDNEASDVKLKTPEACDAEQV